MTLGERIRYVRQLRGMTQTELAEKAGFTADENGRIRISQYENDSRIPRKEQLKKISEALGVTSYYLSLEETYKCLRLCIFLIGVGSNNQFHNPKGNSPRRRSLSY